METANHSLAGSRKWYSSNFMLGIRKTLSLKRPKMPNLDIVCMLSQNLPSVSTDIDIRSMLVKFKKMPDFDVPVSLHKAGSAWKSSNQQDPKDEKIQMLNMMQSFLNKLTPQNFDSIMSKVQGMAIDTVDKLDGFASLLFEKVVSEPNFSEAYAKMARDLVNLSAVDKSGNKVTFRMLLLQKCQKEFQRDKTDNMISELVEKIKNSTIDEEKKILTEQKDIAVSKSKKRSLGNVKFIGELYKLKFLKESIMLECLKKLFVDDEESLECLCNLLTTIGKTLEETSVSKVDMIMKDLEAYKSKKTTPTRIKFMIMDVIDLRKVGWVSKKNENPKTISQIHMDADKEKIEKSIPQMQQRLLPKSTFDSMPSVSNFSRSNDVNFNRMPQNNNSNNVRLGQNSNNWRSAAKVGGKPTEIKSQNRFSFLNQSNKSKEETKSNFVSLGTTKQKR